MRARTILLGGLGALVAADRIALRRFARRDRERFPAPGELFDVGGHRLHLHRVGTGGPAVVVETGFGATSIGWRAVAEELSVRTTVCLYDRAGYGWSDAGPRPRSGDRIADELRTLLDRAGIRPPFVLVGHSLGGLYVRTFALRHPDDVGGIVLVDPAHEDQFPELVRTLGWRVVAPQAGLIAGTALAPFGLVRAGIEAGALPGVARALFDVSEQDRDLLLALSLTTRLRRTLLAEMAAFSATAAEVRGRSLGDVPLEVLSATGTVPGGSDAERDAFRRVWLALHDQLAALSTRSSHTVVDDSGHFIHHDRPDTVVAAIEKTLAAV